MAYQDVQKVAEKRRTIYALNKNLPLPAAEVAKIIEHAVLHTPSSFNSQSTRVVVLFGAEHEKLWQITEDALRAIVPADKFEPTAQKLAMFKAAAGSVLFFEDQEVVQNLQANFPAYADNFPVWAEHTDAMHQYAVWTTLAEAGIIAYSLALAPEIAGHGTFTLIPKDWHEPLLQRMVLLKNAGPVARAFYAYMDSPKALEVMARYGFVRPGGG